MAKNADKVTKGYDVKGIVTVFLWDMPALVEKPDKLSQMIERYKRGNLRPEDKVVVSVLKHRLLRVKDGAMIYERIFGEKAPVTKRKWFTPPDELAVKLRKKSGKGNWTEEREKALERFNNMTLEELVDYIKKHSKGPKKGQEVL